jgi:hypothetical protein
MAILEIVPFKKNEIIKKIYVLVGCSDFFYWAL